MSIRNCETCGNEIRKHPSWARSYYATRRFCNRACQDARRPDVDTAYVVSEAGCWEWQGRLDRNGYGKGYDPNMPPGRRVDWAHRISYRHHKGAIPPRHELDHTCENTACINPDHLEAVTKVEHARRTFERLGKDAMQLRAATLRAGGLTYGEIAEVVGIKGKDGAHRAVAAAIRKGLIDSDALPAGRHILDSADHADMVALYSLGVSQEEIGAWYGVDSSRVSRILTKEMSA